MNHKAAVIEQHPLRAVVALAVQRTAPGALERLLDGVGDGLHLARAECRADHKRLRERAEPGKIQHGDSRGLPALGCLHGSAQFGLSFHQR
jgi:hypothetical protein